MRLLVILSLLLFSFSSQASRLIEIEDYYVQKASDFLKTRYPRKAFTVYVKVDAEDSPQLRNPSSLRQPDSLSLPYLSSVNKSEVNFWDRKDVSLGTLISYLKSIYIKVEIDGQFSNEEMDQLKAEIFKQLKLSELYDRLEINQKTWSPTATWQSYWVPIVAGGLCLVFLAFLLLGISQFGVSRLVKGLAQPLSEIGRSAESVANAGALTGASDNQFNLAHAAWDDGGLDNDTLKWMREEIAKLSPFLANPTAELIQKIEQLGYKNPYAMGAIFSEMDVDTLKSLVVWARGDWWRLAITQVTPLSKQSREFLDQFSQLFVRQQLLKTGKKDSPELLKLKKSLARVTAKQFGKLLDGMSFAQAQPILDLVPQDTRIEVGKYLYPGDWAKLLAGPAKPLDKKAIQDTQAKVLDVCPLKSEEEIAEYFRDADMVQLLDQSTTKDEREIYRALPEESWIVENRIPFYEIFQQNENVLEVLASNTPLEIWANALTACDREECEDIYKFFTARQRFILRQYKSKLENKDINESAVFAKKRILSSFEFIKKTDSQEETQANEASA